MYAPSLQILGSRETGNSVRNENVMSTNTLAEIVSTSLGPQGLDKMLVNEVGEVTITNDGATILNELEVEHPAAQILVNLSKSQDKAVGDGTTSVVIFAGELLKRGNKLINQKIHPSTIISGFKIAAIKSAEFLKKKLRIKTAELDEKSLVNIARTTMSSKILSAESDFFSQMIVDSIKEVKKKQPNGKFKYPIGNVHILKQHGGGMKDSQLIKGYAINRGFVSQQMPKKVKNAKIAFLDFPLRKAKMPLGVNVLVRDVKKLEGIREKEVSMIKERIEKILKAGANVILTTRGIDDLCSKYIVQKDNCVAVRRVDKSDLKKLAQLTGGTVVNSLANLEGGESFSPLFLGECEEVFEDTLAQDELVYFKGCKTGGASTMILRGANEFLLDEMDRTIHDALCTVKRVLESRYIVPGGGCVECGLSVFLEKFATTIESREQLAISEYAEALLCIPKILTNNAAHDATELVAKLRAYHNEAQDDEENKSKYMRYGLELIDGNVIDNVEAGVIEPSLTKLKIIHFATEAATTILRIDDKIQKPEKEKEKKRRPPGVINNFA